MGSPDVQTSPPTAAPWRPWRRVLPVAVGLSLLAAAPATGVGSPSADPAGRTVRATAGDAPTDAVPGAGVSADTVARADTVPDADTPTDTRAETPAGTDHLAAAFLDPEARELLLAARRRWTRREHGILSYEAVVRQRLAVHLRTPLKDRTLYRTETAARVHWNGEDGSVVQVLGAREEHPGGVEPPGSLPGVVEEVFDPADDRIYFGFTDEEDGREDGDDVWIEHPVAPGSETFYRYRTGGTLTLRLPDGRSLRAVELELAPREPSVHLVSGSLWLEPETGALVRAVYRLSRTLDLERDTDEFDNDPDLRWLPGVFRPVEFDVTLVSVDYSLWEFRYWLPHRMRIEGMVRAGILRAPGAHEVSYRVLRIETADSARAETAGADTVPDADTTGRRSEPDAEKGGAARTAQRWLDEEARYGAYEELAGERRNDGRRTRVLVPVDRERLHRSEELPPPLWDDAPGFATEDELEELYDLLSASRPPIGGGGPRTSFAWGPERPDLLRYNRAEGLSVGGRATVTADGRAAPVEGRATARLGLGTWVPDARLEVERTGARHRIRAAIHHRVAEVDPRARGLGPGNSAMALLFGRDDGDYFRATGGELEWSRAGIRRPWYRLTLSAEEHRALPVESDFSLLRLAGRDGATFRPALAAEPTTEYAAALRLEPWWGTDADALQGGVEALLHGALGDHRWVRGRLIGRLAVPLPGGLRAGIEAGGGSILGDAPLQRSWFLGGARTLRGYPGASAVGTRYARGRIEVAKRFPATRISAFSDAGWAADAGGSAFGDALVSAGVGASVLDGLVRLDLARALRRPTGWRLELYVDAVL